MFVIRNFKVHVTLTNHAGQTIPASWTPYFTSANGEVLSNCYWTDNHRQVAPGQNTTVVRGTFVEPNDWMIGIHFTELNQRLDLCFNQVGQEIGC